MSAIDFKDFNENGRVSKSILLDCDVRSLDLFFTYIFIEIFHFGDNGFVATSAFCFYLKTALKVMIE
jgi:hypothetical protein